MRTGKGHIAVLLRCRRQQSAGVRVRRAQQRRVFACDVTVAHHVHATRHRHGTTTTPDGRVTYSPL